MEELGGIWWRAPRDPHFDLDGSWKYPLRVLQSAVFVQNEMFESDFTFFYLSDDCYGCLFVASY